MNKFIYKEQTTQDAVRHQSFNQINVAKKLLKHMASSFLLFFSCIHYTFVVNIMPLFGTYQISMQKNIANLLCKGCIAAATFE